MRSTAVGNTSLWVAFPDNPMERWRCNFAVVKNCPSSVVFGDHFLRVVTETVTKFRHRVKKAISSLAKRTWRLMYMQRPRQKLECFIDSELVFANADTGSDIDLVSLEYAKLRDWDISRLPDDEGFVVLADSTVAKVFGHVMADLRIGGNSTGQKMFYVLDGLVSNVVLGDPTLDGVDVFNAHVDSFIDLEGTDEIEEFYLIVWVEKLEAEVSDFEAILSGTTTGPPVAAPRRFRGHFRRLVGRDKGSNIGQTPDEVKVQLRRLLERLEGVEQVLSDTSLEKRGHLIGNELRQELSDDAARRIRYQDLCMKTMTATSCQ